MIERQAIHKERVYVFRRYGRTRPQTRRTCPVEFTFDESLVRTVIKDGEAWFVAKDVCDILDIDDPSMAVEPTR